VSIDCSFSSIPACFLLPYLLHEADTGGSASVVRRLDTRTGFIYAFAGNGTATYSGVSSNSSSGILTFGIAWDAAVAGGSLLIGEVSNHSTKVGGTTGTGSGGFDPHVPPTPSLLSRHSIPMAWYRGSCPRVFVLPSVAS
jgi:hypothetical protein